MIKFNDSDDKVFSQKYSIKKIPNMSGILVAKSIKLSLRVLTTILVHVSIYSHKIYLSFNKTLVRFWTMIMSKGH